MTGPRELHPCGYCNRSGRDLDVKLTVAAVAREAVIARRAYTGPLYATEYRCRPCREAVRLHQSMPHQEEDPQ